MTAIHIDTEKKMTSKIVKVQNRAGIHGRPSTLITQTASKFISEIFIEYGGAKINAKSVIGIMTMAAAYGTELNITADGEDEEQAINAISYLFDSKFEEA